MRDKDVLDTMVTRGKAAHSAAKKRAAAAGRLVIQEVGGTAKPKTNEIETYSEWAASIEQILGIAGELAAVAINPNKVRPVDVGEWSLGGTDEHVGHGGRPGWEIKGRGDERLWLYRHTRQERGRLVQQRRFPGIENVIRESTYPSDGSPMRDVWETETGTSDSSSYGPFTDIVSAQPYERYRAVERVSDAFFAFLASAHVIDSVRRGVAERLAANTQA